MWTASSAWSDQSWTSNRSVDVAIQPATRDEGVNHHSLVAPEVDRQRDVLVAEFADVTAGRLPGR
jgi:hypothetical protein